MTAAAAQDIAQFRAAIAARLPHLGGAPLRILGQGWHSTALLVDEAFVVKFPRGPAAEAALRREAALLAIVGTVSPLPVPAMVLHDGAPPISVHPLLPGEQLLAADYARLDDDARDQLARDLAGFHAALHRMPPGRMRSAGANDIGPWPPVTMVRDAGLPLLPADLRPLAASILAEYAALPPDPLGMVYGFFDGHGWNMAFDRSAGRLNGVYDFGDSGIGPLHQEFIYAALVAPDLSRRLVAAYRRETGLPVDGRRVAILTAMHRIVELADSVRDPEHLPAMRDAAISHLRAEALLLESLVPD